MENLPRSLRWLTRIVRGSTIAIAALIILGEPVFWTHPEVVREYAQTLSGLPKTSIVVDAQAQWLGFLGSLPLVGVSLFGLWQLRSWIGTGEVEHLFRTSTQRHLRLFAWALLSATILTPLQSSWMSIAFSAGMPPGQHMLTVWVSADMLAPLVAGIVLLVIATVLSQASLMAERSREIEVAGIAKSRFLAAASHDLRQPVVSINLLTELLREQPLPAAAAAILARIGDSVQALNQLLKGLLDLSRFEAGTVQAHKACFALRPLLVRTINDEAEGARRKGIALRLRAPPFEVQSDPVLLEQILRNLVGNAVRYTRRGGVLVCARRRGSGGLLVQVWDTGPGIPVESQSLVFEEFAQLDPNEHGRSGGLGLGLALVRRAASVLGAPLTFRSVVDRGTCFSIELALVGFESTQSGETSVSRSRLRGQLIWVVEDDAQVRESLRLRLSGWGASVRDFACVDSVREALADRGGDLPDLLVSDQRLPDGTGVEVAILLRTASSALRVLIVTGDTAPNDIALLHASGLPVLHKPFTSEGLLAAIHALGLRNRIAP